MSINPCSFQNIPVDVQNALKDVMEYSFEDELSDFIETNAPEKHIFRSLVILDNYMTGNSLVAEDYFDAENAKYPAVEFQDEE